MLRCAGNRRAWGKLASCVGLARVRYRRLVRRNRAFLPPSRTVLIGPSPEIIAGVEGVTQRLVNDVRLTGVVDQGARHQLPAQANSMFRIGR